MGRGVRQQQEGKIRIRNLLKKGFNLAKPTAKSCTGRSLAKIAIENAATPYEKGAQKIKSEKICRELNSDLANTTLDYEWGYAYNKLG